MTAIAPGRSLVASINGRPVGVLKEEGAVWSFQYDPDWLRDPEAFPLSPKLPLKAEALLDGASDRPVQWFFDNLLPEEHAREVLAKEAGVETNDAWGLLAYFGAESAGAITLLPPDTQSGTSGLRPLPDEALQRRIDMLPQRSLSADSPKRMSLAGAQQKLAVTVKDGALLEPFGNECSTHILKPDSKVEGYPHTAINELFCMRLAHLVGLPVPNTEMRYVPWPVYLVERFDRESHDAQLKRRHILDALQLLSYDRRLKYAKSSAETLNAAIAACRTVAKAKQAIFRWTVYNVLIGNADAHMKNLSFFISSAGVTLAPFYDLVSTVVYTTPQYDRHGPHWPDVSLSMPIGNAGRFVEITRPDLLAFGGEIGLKPMVAKRHLDTLLEKMQTAAPALLEELSAAALPGEQRILQSIYHLPIREMGAKLQG